MQSPTPPSASNAQPKSREAEPPIAPAVPKSRYALFLSIAATGCAVDLLSKHWIFQWRGIPPPWGDVYPPDHVWWIWEGYIGIETSVNWGYQYGDEPIRAVRDWILLQAGNLPLPPWPNFNVADSMLVCGAVLLVWHALVHHEKKDTVQSTEK